MPVASINKYICPVHEDEFEYAYDTPPGWFYLNNEVYCPSVGHELASYLEAHPDSTMADAVASLTA